MFNIGDKVKVNIDSSKIDIFKRASRDFAERFNGVEFTISDIDIISKRYYLDSKTYFSMSDCILVESYEKKTTIDLLEYKNTLDHKLTVEEIKQALTLNNPYITYINKLFSFDLEHEFHTVRLSNNKDYMILTISFPNKEFNRYTTKDKRTIKAINKVILNYLKSEFI